MRFLAFCQICYCGSLSGAPNLRQGTPRPYRPAPALARLLQVKRRFPVETAANDCLVIPLPSTVAWREAL
jgi:hypothetical protein